MTTPTPVHTAHECYCGLHHGLDGMTDQRALGPEANAIYRALKKTSPNYIDIGEDYEYAALAADIAANLGVIVRGELDLAWAEAEAALPEGWQLYGIHFAGAFGWWAGATPSSQVTPFSVNVTDGAFGPTPAAALRALAAKLRA